MKQQKLAVKIKYIMSMVNALWKMNGKIIMMKRIITMKMVKLIFMMSKEKRMNIIMIKMR